jgi:hypothetical protein
MKTKLGRWYKVTDVTGTPSHFMLILVEKEAKLGYLKIPVTGYGLASRATAGYEDIEYHFDWLSTQTKLMPTNFKPEDIISESATHKVIRVIWS